MIIAVKTSNWTAVTCHECGGHGVVSDYGDGQDFYGPKGCSVCQERGLLCRSPSGRLAIYPGGKFKGRSIE